MDNLLSTAWLADRLGEVVVLDASYHLPDTGRDARFEFDAGHIAGARFLDLGALNDPDAPLANTIPTPEGFARHVAALGVSDGDKVVLYDDSALHSASRAWFLFNLFGFENVAVLDGGLAGWKAAGQPMEHDVAAARPGTITPRPNSALVRDKAQVLAIVNDGSAQIVDARGPGRFSGEEPESRPGLASGHIPGAANVPIGLLFDAGGTMKDRTDLSAAFEAAGVDLARPVVTACGSGVTAAVLLHALTRLGKKDVALYDGSWAEWGADPETPKATGR